MNTFLIVVLGIIIIYLAHRLKKVTDAFKVVAELAVENSKAVKMNNDGLIQIQNNEKILLENQKKLEGVINNARSKTIH